MVDEANRRMDTEKSTQSVMLVDYPGFNLIGKVLKDEGISSKVEGG